MKLLMALKCPLPENSTSFYISISSFSHNCLPELICPEKHHNSCPTARPIIRKQVFHLQKAFFTIYCITDRIEPSHCP